MIKTLRLSSNAPVLTTVSGKRLRLTAPTAIIKEAASGKPEAALVASQTERGRLIRRFEGDQNSEEELYHKEPQRVHTGMESFKFGAQPITIAIRADGDWKILARKVTYDQTEMKKETMSTKSEANLNRPTKTQRVKRQRTNENFGKRKRTIVGKCDETGRLYKADIYLAETYYPVPVIMTPESLRQASRKSEDKDIYYSSKGEE
ncbi:hypothetical protein UCRPC4_g00198 [Phaeomoniella chlamydospora]|uniref:Uncharacterized protein n=1 Tax=Phaeomoniella chlamydospora TaxID=158046 RepID=A0A0G2F423_PHACM|nr:hypothetical protein UCRPC4_g00198 [Phaeomoniella chlamydospora]